MSKREETFESTAGPSKATVDPECAEDACGESQAVVQENLSQQRDERASKLETEAAIISELRQKLTKIHSFDGKEDVEVFRDDLYSEVEQAVNSAIKHLNNIGNSLNKMIEVHCNQLQIWGQSRLSMDESTVRKLNEADQEIRRFGDIVGQMTMNDIERLQEIDMQLSLIYDQRKKGFFAESELKYLPNDQFEQSVDHLGRLLNTSSAKNSTLKIAESLQRTMSRHLDTIYQLIFLPNGNLVSCSRDRNVLVWNSSSGEVINQLREHSGAVLSIAFIKRRIKRWLASGSADCTIKIWSLDEPVRSINTLSGHTGGVFSLKVISRNSLASSAYDNTIRLWNPKKGEQTRVLSLAQYRIKAGLGLILNDRLVFYGRRPTGNQSDELMVWNSSTEGKIVSYPGQEKSANLIEVLTNNEVAVGYDNGMVIIFNLVNDAKTRRLPKCHESRITTLLELPRGLLLTASFYGQPVLKIWNIEDLQLVKVLLDADYSPLAANRSIAFYPELGLLACAFENREIKIFELNGLADDAASAVDLLNKRYNVIEFVPHDAYFRTFIVHDRKEMDRKILMKFFTGSNSRVSVVESGLTHTLLKIKHTNLVKLTDCFSLADARSKTFSYLVTEDFMSWSSLRDYIIEDFTLEQRMKQGHDRKSLQWFTEILSAVVYLCSNGIFHNGLTSKSVRLVKNQVKIELPDLSKIVDENSQDIGSLEDMRYFSPQRIQASSHRKPNSKDNSWAVGCILFELVNLRPAFEGSNPYDLSKAIVENKATPVLNHPEYQSLYEKLLNTDEDKRIHIGEAEKLFVEIRKAILLDETNFDEYTARRSEQPEQETRFQLIDPTAFSSWQESNSLNLSHNKFQTIQADCFSQLSKRIEQLSLNKNCLVFVEPSALNGFSSLKTLNLSDNQLEVLSPSLFSDLVTLRHLDLSRNRLFSLAGEQFKSLSNLGFLDLSFNQIRSIAKDVFAELRSVQVLNLNNNKILELKPGALENTPELMKLNLDRNRLTSVNDQLFKTTVKLLELKLSRNNIDSIAQDAFERLVNLRHLDLSHNQLTNLSANQFEFLPSLQRLDLASNFLESVDHLEFTPNSRLRDVSLKDNRIRKIDLAVFSGLVRLKSLDLSDNFLSELSHRKFARRDVTISVSGNQALLNNPDFRPISESLRIFAIDHINCIKTRTEPKARLEIGLENIAILDLKEDYRSDVLKVLFLRHEKVVTCSGSIKIWDLNSGEMLLQLDALSDSYHSSIAELPTGLLAFGSSDFSINLWNVETGEQIAILKSHSQEITEFASLPNGDFVSCSKDGAIHIWNLDSVESPRLSIRETPSSLRMGVLSTGTLVTCSNNGAQKTAGKLKLWSTENGKLIKSLKPLANFAYALLVLSNDHVALGLSDGSVAIVDVIKETSQIIRIDGGEVYSLLEWPNGHLLSIDKDIRVWDLREGELVYKLPTLNQNLALSTANSSPNNALAAFTQDSRIIHIKKLQLRV